MDSLIQKAANIAQLIENLKINAQVSETRIETIPEHSQVRSI